MRTRTTSWWLAQLRKRRERMTGDDLDLSTPVAFETREEQDAAIAFFNAALRAEESGLRQAHELADRMGAVDPELGLCLRLYGDEEGWHRQLLTKFLGWLGGGVRPMGRTTRLFYDSYARAKRMESVILVNLMFETIGATTYRLALRRAEHPVVRRMLTILTRDESFHVPLNVHFLRAVLDRATPATRRRLRVLYHTTFVALLASTGPSRRRAQRFDRIPRAILARAYASELASLFLQERDLGLAPSPLLLRALGIDAHALVHEGRSPGGVEAAERSADRDQVTVDAY